MPTSQQLRDGFIQMINAIEPSAMVTLNFSHRTGLKRAGQDVEFWFKNLEQEHYGKRWYLQPPHKRLRAYAFFEHPDSNLHAHCALGGPHRLTSMALQRGIPIWRDITRSGHGDAQAIHNEEAVARYFTKCSKSPWWIDSFVAYGPDRR